MAMVMRDWLNAIIENELRGAIEWQKNESGTIPEALEHGALQQDRKQPRDKSPSTQARFGGEKKYQDNGSALIISCTREDSKFRPAQLIKFLSYEVPYQCVISDAHTSVKAKVTGAASTRYMQQHHRPFSNKTQGGLLQLLDFDIVFSRNMTDEERLTILIKDFAYKGSVNSAVHGAPLPVQSKTTIRDLLDKLEDQEQHEETADVDIVDITIPEISQNVSRLQSSTLSRGITPGEEVEKAESSNPVSQLASQIGSRLHRRIDSDIVLLGGTNLAPPDRLGRVSQDSASHKKDQDKRYNGLLQLLAKQKHGVLAPVQNAKLPENQSLSNVQSVSLESSTNSRASARENGLEPQLQSENIVQSKRPAHGENEQPRQADQDQDEMNEMDAINEDGKLVSKSITISDADATMNEEHYVHTQPGNTKVSDTANSRGSHVLPALPSTPSSQARTNFCEKHPDDHNTAKRATFDADSNRQLAPGHPPSGATSATTGTNGPEDTIDIHVKSPKSREQHSPTTVMAVDTTRSEKSQNQPTAGSTFLHEGNFGFVRMLSNVDINPVDQTNLLSRAESWHVPLPGIRFPSPNIPVAILKAFNTAMHQKHVKQSSSISSVKHMARNTNTPTGQDPKSSEMGSPPTSQEIVYTWSPSPIRRIQPGGSLVLPPDSSASGQGAHGTDSPTFHRATSAQAISKSTRAIHKPVDSLAKPLIVAVTTSLPSDSSEIEMTVPRALPVSPALSVPLRHKEVESNQSPLHSRDKVEIQSSQIHSSSPPEASDPRTKLRLNRPRESTSPEVFIPGTFRSGSFQSFGKRHVGTTTDGTMDGDPADHDDAVDRQLLHELSQHVHPDRAHLIQNTSSPNHVSNREQKNVPQPKRKRDPRLNSDQSPTPAKRPHRLDLGLEGSSQPATQNPAQAARQARRDYFHRDNFVQSALPQPHEDKLRSGSEIKHSVTSPGGSTDRQGFISTESIPFAKGEAQTRTDPSRLIKQTCEQSFAANSASISVKSATHSVDTAGQTVSNATVLETFQHAYPNYTGNLKHFQSLCRKIESEPMLHRSLWDDFVMRHNVDYSAYLIKCAADGEDAVPYEQFYREEIESPRYDRHILNPKSLKEALANTARTTANVSGNAMSAEGNTSPHSLVQDVSNSNAVLSMSSPNSSRPQSPPSSSPIRNRCQPPRGPGPGISAQIRNDSYRPTYSSPPTGPSGSFRGSRGRSFERFPQRGARVGHSTPSQHSRRQLPWSRQDYNSSKQKVEAPRSALSSGASEKGHCLPSQKEIQATPVIAVDKKDYTQEAISVSSVSSSRVESSPPINTTEGLQKYSTHHAATKLPAAEAAEAQEDTRRQSAWWEDDNTPFKQFVRNYAALKVHGGALGRPGTNEVLDYGHATVNFADWHL